ncbi:Low molecular weight phosphatase family [Proteiniphilum saccharofermentans]|uniref:Low molecular weight phosphatase family n=1 Tax=Proteiniphilum saccharofermentans TaxID=1642647 RepID=A0A1R3TAM9_9BACT|nr:low molecular weight protein-tyrosine-phosphatase [Proteiniphilum saccharofermentans]SCD20654.1 Low molecular weight phosphatase family [Proteiniphilum saccharofermentans]
MMASTEGKKKEIRLLFVCLGNICRSPAAEGIMATVVEKNGLQDLVEVDSAGTSGWHQGELPDERMRLHGERRGYNFDSRARKFKKSDFNDFDYILVMDRQNYANVKALATSQEQIDKIHMMTEFSRQYTHHDHIPDPYYGGASGFELVLDLLEDACEGLLQAIKRKYGF